MWMAGWLRLDGRFHPAAAVHVRPSMRTVHRIPCSCSSSISAPRRRRTMLPADVRGKHVPVLARFRAKRQGLSLLVGKF